MEFLLALQFLTVIPITVRGQVTEEKVARSMAFFPAVGLVIGMLTAGFYYGLAQIFPASVCDLLAIIFMVIITGNMHGDALMDTADGLFSGKPRDKMMEIMKDSRAGAHGVMAGILLVLSKLVLLGQLPLDTKILVLILLPVVGRWPQVYGAARYPYARPDGGTGSFTRHVGVREILWATATVTAVVSLILGIKGIALIGAAVAGTIILGWFIVRKLGGVTGDTLGAMTEVIEVITLLVLYIIMVRLI